MHFPLYQQPLLEQLLLAEKGEKQIELLSPMYPIVPKKTEKIIFVDSWSEKMKNREQKISMAL